MGEENVKLGEGTLYIKGEEIGNVQEAEFTEEPDEMREFVDGLWNLTMAGQEFSCTIEMATDAYVKMTHALLGIDKYLYENCSSRRVAHLARHARKMRTRRKNYKRMIKLCEKEKKDD